MDLKKFKGIFPAFPACYNDSGEIDSSRIQDLVRYCAQRGANGIYITGSSGEFPYQSVEERMQTMKAVMECAEGLTVIAHVGASSTKDSIRLAAYAAECGCDAIASVPPYYYAQPDYSIVEYWNAIIDAAKLPFFLYNIPGTTGTTVSPALFSKMLENPYVAGIKNTTLPVMDILLFKECAPERCVVFNGPDEQFVAGRLMGADGGIGSTYIVLLDLFIKADECIRKGDYVTAGEIQRFLTPVILRIVRRHGHMLSAIKYLLHLQGFEAGEARLPMAHIDSEDRKILDDVAVQIALTTEKYCGVTPGRIVH